MAWRLLIEADILTGLTGAETAAFTTAALKAGQANPLQEVIDQVTQEMRGHIADCERNALAAGVTLPDRCVLHAVAIVRYRLMSRLGLRVADGREQEYRDARRFLERVSECKVRIERPAGEVAEEESSAGMEVVRTPERNMTATKLKGL